MAFAGFPPAAFSFLAALDADNSKATFEARRSEYDDALLEPAKDLVVDLGEELRTRVSTAIHADPRVNGSIFRINRDIRFSKDKTPYKTHLDLFFWEGAGRSRERPGLFVRITPQTVLLGSGMHRFDGPLLERYRLAVLDERSGEALAHAVDRVLAAGAELGGSTYRRVPSGLAADHPRAELLKHSALYAHQEWPLPAEVGSAAFVDWCAVRLEPLAPIHRWLSDTVFR